MSDHADWEVVDKATVNAMKTELGVYDKRIAELEKTTIQQSITIRILQTKIAKLKHVMNRQALRLSTVQHDEKPAHYEFRLDVAHMLFDELEADKGESDEG